MDYNASGWKNQKGERIICNICRKDKANYRLGGRLGKDIYFICDYCSFASDLNILIDLGIPLMNIPRVIPLP